MARKVQRFGAVTASGGRGIPERGDPQLFELKDAVTLKILS